MGVQLTTYDLKNKIDEFHSAWDSVVLDPELSTYYKAEKELIEEHIEIQTPQECWVIINNLDTEIVDSIFIDQLRKKANFKNEEV